MEVERLGRLIGERRRELGLSQAELAEQAGISRAYLSEVERGRVKNPGWQVVYGLVQLLGLASEVLFDGPHYSKSLVMVKRERLKENEILRHGYFYALGKACHRAGLALGEEGEVLIEQARGEYLLLLSVTTRAALWDLCGDLGEAGDAG